MAQVATAAAPTRDLSRRVRSHWSALPVVIRYGIAGGATQVVYLGVLGGALAGGAFYMGALLVAQLAAMSFAFPVYRGLVFRAHGPLPRQILAFLGVWWSGAVTSLVGVPLLVETVHVGAFLAQIAVLCVVVSLSFLTHLRVTFRQRH